MAKKIVIKTDIDNKQSIKSLNQMEQELSALKEQIGKTTDPKEFSRLSKEIKKSESSFKDLNKSFEGLDAEQKAGELGKIAGGIGAIGTAAAVVSVGNEDIEKLFATLATGIAITNGIKGASDAYSGAQKLLRKNTMLSTVATKASTIGTAIWATTQKIATLVVKDTSKSLKGFKVALLSTGIGAIIIGIGLLVANFDKVAAAIGWVADLIYSLFKPAIDAVIDALQFLGIMESDTAIATREAQDIAIEAYADTRKELDKLLSKTQEMNDEVLAGLDRDIARRKAAGEDTKTIERERLKVLIKNAEKEFLINKERRINFENDFKLRKARNEITKEEADALLTEIENIKNFEKTQTILIKKLRNDRSVFDIKSRKEQEDKRDKLSSDRRDKRKKVEDDAYLNSLSNLRRTLVLIRRKRDEQIKIVGEGSDAAKLIRDKANSDETKAIIKAEESRLKITKKGIVETLDLRKTAGEELVKQTQDTSDEVDKILRKSREKLFNSNSEAFNFSMRNIQAVSDLFSAINDKKSSEEKRQIDGINAREKAALSNKMLSETQRMNLEKKFATQRDVIAKKEFERNKKMQIANAIIAGASSVVNALAQPPGPPLTIPLGILAAALTGVQIAKIKNTTFTSSASSIGVSGSLPSGQSAPTPSNNTLLQTQNLPGQSTETVGAGAGQLQAVPPIQAFVLESDITNSQNNLSSLQAQSEIG